MSRNDKPTVLLVYDHYVFVKAYAEALGEQGFDVIVAEDLDDARAAVERTIFDLVIVDLMHGRVGTGVYKTGYGFASWLTAISPVSVVVVFSDGNAKTVKEWCEAILSIWRGSSRPACRRVLLLLHKFRDVAEQLEKRHAGRDSLQIRDEYDAQDLTHALLRIEFDEVVRLQESMPSGAADGARVSFLLKHERVIVKVKMIVGSVVDREVSEQLLLDICWYREHGDCDALIFFIYDPERRLASPEQLQRDAEKQSNRALIVVVYVQQ